jgi:class 3 adenylate cyclase
MSELPTGTATFFFSDIEGSTKLIQQLGERYPDVPLAHHTLLRAALAANGGHELRTEGDDRFDLAWSLHTLGLLAFKSGRVDAARAYFSEALTLFVQAQDVSGMVLQLDNLSAVARLEGDPIGATRLAGAAAAHQRTTGAGLGGLLSSEEGRNGREGLSEAAGEAAWTEGRR